MHCNKNRSFAGVPDFEFQDSFTFLGNAHVVRPDLTGKRFDAHILLPWYHETMFCLCFQELPVSSKEYVFISFSVSEGASLSKCRVVEEWKAMMHIFLGWKLCNNENDWKMSVAWNGFSMEKLAVFVVVFCCDERSYWKTFRFFHGKSQKNTDILGCQKTAEVFQ